MRYPPVLYQTKGITCESFIGMTMSSWFLQDFPESSPVWRELPLSPGKWSQLVTCCPRILPQPALSPISMSVSLTEGKHVFSLLIFRLPCADPRNLDSHMDRDVACP